MYISVGALDTLKISFYNTKVWISPIDDKKNSIPDGYILAIKVPPQGKNLLSSSEVETAKLEGQTFVIMNLIIRTFFKTAMNMLLGSIIMMQILAHLPLADITLPANAHQ